MSRVLVPGSALLVAGVDPGEGAAMHALRERAVERLRGSTVCLGIRSATLDPGSRLIASLGGIGVDRAVSFQVTPGAALEPEPMPCAEISGLLAAGRAELMSPGDAVLALLALDAEPRDLRLIGAGGRVPPAGESEAHLAQIDLPAASHPGSPLPYDPMSAPLRQEILSALASGDRATLRSLAEPAAGLGGHLEAAAELTSDGGWELDQLTIRGVDLLVAVAA